ncbi:MAG: RNA methyltransferase [Candidatus Nanopelagicales bacterium]
MRPILIADPADPRVGAFTGLTDVAARAAREPAEGLFIAEGARVITRAVAAGYVPRSVLTEAKWLPSLAGSIDLVDVEVLVASPDVLREVTGYRVHRGALAAMERRPLPPVGEVVTGAGLVAVLVDLVDHTNVGAIFRNAAALGVDAILCTPGCADPLYRRSVKVSMGAVLTVPWTRTGTDPLGELGWFTTLALTPAGDAFDIDRAARGAIPRAVLLGTEGDGLPLDLLERVDARVRIPMSGGVDSLNVAAASAIAFHLLSHATRSAERRWPGRAGLTCSRAARSRRWSR